VQQMFNIPFLTRLNLFTIN